MSDGQGTDTGPDPAAGGLATLAPPDAPPSGAPLDAPQIDGEPMDTGGAGIGPRRPVDEAGAPDRPSPPGHLLRRFVRGRRSDPAWVRPTLILLLVGTAALYLWDLGSSGWANSFYSAAVQAGTKSWKAFFFGSFDGSNFITVDKPPAFLWVMDLSARIFGVNSWSILVPEALEGVGTVWLTYLCVRRWFTPGAALLSGAVVALTPVATLMFRYNNPDALLTLLLAASAYGTIRALERGRTWWLVLAGAGSGLAFLTKQLEGLIVLPVLGLVYLLCGPPRLGRRILQTAALGLAALVSGGWWVAAVQLIPASARPYVGGSTDNSELNLIFGYNGFGRVTGNERGSVGGTGVAGNMWGPTGWSRLFNSQMGGQISWLIPAALVGLASALWLTRRAPRHDRTRAAALLFGGWLLLMGAVFSFSKGIIHPYYTIALAPPVGALVGMGASMLWSRRRSLTARFVLGGTLIGTIVWGFTILGWSPQWNPALRWAIVVVGGLAVLGILVCGLRRRVPRVVLAVVAGLGIAAALAGPAAYALDTTATPHDGAIPSAGPAVINGVGPGGFPGFRGFGGARGGGAGGPAFGGGPGAGPRGGFGGGGFGGGGGAGGGLGPILNRINRRGITLPPGFTLPNGTRLRNGFSLPPGALGRLAPGGGRGFGGAGGLLNASAPGRQLVALLQHDAGHYTWVAATVGANSAAGYQLGTGDPIMAIGGFNGTDPAPSLATFQKDVAEGRIHYFISGGFGGFAAGGFGGFGRTGGTVRRGAGSPTQTSDASAISAWVTSHYTSTTVDGVTVYDLTAPLTSANAST